MVPEGLGMRLQEFPPDCELLCCCRALAPLLAVSCVLPLHRALEGTLSLTHTGWGCQAQLHQLDFQFTRKIKCESSKEFMELCIIYL